MNWPHNIYLPRLVTGIDLHSMPINPFVDVHTGAGLRAWRSVVHITSPERSFHILYQLCAGASAAERAAWHLPPAADAAKSFAYLSQSSCFSIPDVDNAEEYQVRVCVPFVHHQQRQACCAVAHIYMMLN